MDAHAVARMDGRAAIGGLRRLSELHALLPRLGAFIGKEAQVPYDYDELLAAIAPRPTLLYTPRKTGARHTKKSRRASAKRRRRGRRKVRWRS